MWSSVIAVALITFVAVVGHGYRTGLASAHERLIKADYALTGEHGTVTPHAVHALAGVKGVVASEIRSGEAELAGKAVHVAGDEHRRPDLLVVKQERPILEQAALAPAVDDLLDRLPLADVKQSHCASILAVFEPERGDYDRVLALC